MVWFKVSDKLHSDESAIEAGLRAIGLWTMCGSWSSDQERDGFVPKSIMVRLGGKPADARLLIDCGLWTEEERGYRFNKWAKYNPLKIELEARRDKERVKKAKGRCRHHHGQECWDDQRESCTRSEGVPNVSPGDNQGESHKVSPSESACPDPTRPDPNLNNNHHPTEVTTYDLTETSDDDFHSLDTRGVF